MLIHNSKHCSVSFKIWLQFDDVWWRGKCILGNHRFKQLAHMGIWPGSLLFRFRVRTGYTQQVWEWEWVWVWVWVRVVLSVESAAALGPAWWQQLESRDAMTLLPWRPEVSKPLQKSKDGGKSLSWLGRGAAAYRGVFTVTSLTSHPAGGSDEVT